MEIHGGPAMSESSASSGPILQLLANGLGLWIRSQCDEVGELKLNLHGSALQLLRGRLDAVDLKARRVSFQGLPIQHAELRSGALKVNLRPGFPQQVLQLQQAFSLTGGVTLQGTDLNRALLSDHWRWLGDWLAEQLLGLPTLGSLTVNNDILLLEAPVINAGDSIRRQFRLQADAGTLRIEHLDADEAVHLPMDPGIRIKEARLQAGQLHLLGEATVKP